MNNVDIGWNIVQAASSYSTLAGTLAALVFAAIIVLLSNPPRNQQSGGDTGSRSAANAVPSHLFYGLLVAFASLALTSFLWGDLTGQDLGAQAYLLGISTTLALVLSALQLLLSLMWCFVEYQLKAPLRGAYLLFFGVLIIGASHLVVGFGDYFQVSEQGRDWTIFHSDLLWAALPCLIAAPFVGLIPRFIAHLKAAKVYKRRLQTGLSQKAEEEYAEQVYKSAVGAYKVAVAASAVIIILLAAIYGFLSDLIYTQLAQYYPWWATYVVIGVICLCEAFYVAGMGVDHTTASVAQTVSPQRGEPASSPSPSTPALPPPPATRRG